MVMRSDSSTSAPQGTTMARTKKLAPSAAPQLPAAAPPHHHSHLGSAAHAGMRHLAASGQQSVSVAQVDFAELADEGPTARAPRPVNR